MNKSAETRYPISTLISERWSPRAFSEQEIKQEQLLALFEAARWAPSGGNRQPWFFLVTHKGTQTYEKLYATLKNNNLRWANTAPVLVLTVMNPIREDGRYNHLAGYDLGQAVANLATQATADGLYVHQMGGFDRNRAAELFDLPEGYEAMTVLALGYLGSPETLPEDLAEREMLPRERKPLNEFVFDGEWGNPIL